MPRKILSQKFCPNCSKLFDVTTANPTQTACSRICVDAYRQIEKECKECGEKYRVKRSHAKTSVYCSKKCQSNYRSKYFTGKNAANYQLGKYCESKILKCEVCGVKFQCVGYSRKTCSENCQNYLKGFRSKNRTYPNRVLCVCEICGKEKLLPPCFAKDFRFCSKKCRAKWQSERMSGQNHPNWNGGDADFRSRLGVNKKYKNWRNEVFSRDGYTCQICGDNKGGNLHSHHIKPLATHPELVFLVDNGMTLCDKCHNAVHSGLPSIKPKRNYKKIIENQK